MRWASTTKTAMESPLSLLRMNWDHEPFPARSSRRESAQTSRMISERTHVRCYAVYGETEHPTSNIQHPTSNIQHPTDCTWSTFGWWSFDVGSWMFSAVHGEGTRSLRIPDADETDRDWSKPL